MLGEGPEDVGSGWEGSVRIRDQRNGEEGDHGGQSGK